MRLNGLLFFLLAYRFGYCGVKDLLEGATGSDSSGGSRRASREVDSEAYPTPTPRDIDYTVTLDLSKDDNPNVSRGMINSGGREQIYFTAHPKRPIIAIVDAQQQVWTGDADVTCRTARLFYISEYKLLCIFIGGHGKYDYKYYENVEGTWKNITREAYNRKYGKGIDRESTGQVLPFTLDIANPVHPKLVTRDRHIGGICLRTFITMAGSEIGSVVSGDFVFWKSEKGTSLDLCTERIRGNHHLLYLRILDNGSKRNLYFGGLGKMWSKIDEEDYYEQLCTMENTGPNRGVDEDDDDYKSSRRSPNGPSPMRRSSLPNDTENSTMPELDLVLATKKLVNELTMRSKLDLAFPDASKIRYTENVRENVKEFTYIPKEGVFNKVVDGAYTLWTSKSGEECAEAQLYIRGNKKLINIRTISNGRSVFVCFGKAGNVWSPLTGKDFYKKLFELRHKEMEESTTSKESGFYTPTIVLPFVMAILFWL